MPAGGAGKSALSRGASQTQRALAQALAALGLNPLAIPQAFVVVLPTMKSSAFPYALGPHMLTVEDLTPAVLARKLEALLPRLDLATCAQIAPALESIAAALTRHGDDEIPDDA